MLGRCCYSSCGSRVGHACARAVARAARRFGFMRRFHLPVAALELDHDALAGLIKLWQRIHFSAGDGMMPAEELLTLYRLAATWPVSGDVVELGSWVGLTTSYLATACRVRGDERVYAVDTFHGTKEGDTTYPSVARYGGNTLDAFRNQIEKAKVADVVKTLVGDTGEVAARYPGRGIRMLLIDADHSYDGVRNDFERWLPHVAPGGLIVFHDYLMHDIARYVDGAVSMDHRVSSVPGELLPNMYGVTKLAMLTSPHVHEVSQTLPMDTLVPA